MRVPARKRVRGSAKKAARKCHPSQSVTTWPVVRIFEPAVVPGHFGGPECPSNRRCCLSQGVAALPSRSAARSNRRRWYSNTRHSRMDESPYGNACSTCSRTIRSAGPILAATSNPAMPVVLECLRFLIGSPPRPCRPSAGVRLRPSLPASAAAEQSSPGRPRSRYRTRRNQACFGLRWLFRDKQTDKRKPALR